MGCSAETACSEGTISAAEHRDQREEFSNLIHCCGFKASKWLCQEGLGWDLFLRVRLAG